MREKLAGKENVSIASPTLQLLYASKPCSVHVCTIVSECEAACSLAVVARLCHGRQNCTVTADADTFGRPCRPGTTEYLHVVYACGLFTSKPLLDLQAVV